MARLHTVHLDESTAGRAQLKPESREMRPRRFLDVLREKGLRPKRAEILPSEKR